MAWVRFGKKAMPEGLWSKCTACGAMIYQKDAEAKKKVCPECDFHFPINVADRIAFTLDEGSWTELWPDIETEDRLQFVDREPYPEKLAAVKAKTGRSEAMVVGLGKVRGRNVVFGALEFKFLGGSMGAVVGEKVTLAVEEARRRHWPLILVSASGGARMHEGVISLMQMAKTCAALARFSDEGGLYIAILAHPTTGGVTASWATQADIVLTEPGALIGFAGPRVIQTTLRQELPPGFQRSEFLLEKGQIDRIVQRGDIPDTLALIIDTLVPQPDAETDPPGDAEPASRADKEQGRHGAGAAKGTRAPATSAGDVPGHEPGPRPGSPSADHAATGSNGKTAPAGEKKAARGEEKGPGEDPPARSAPARPGEGSRRARRKGSSNGRSRKATRPARQQGGGDDRKKA